MEYGPNVQIGGYKYVWHISTLHYQLLQKQLMKKRICLYNKGTEHENRIFNIWIFKEYKKQK